MTMLCASLAKFSFLQSVSALLCVFGEGNERKGNLPALAECFGTSGHFVIAGSLGCIVFESFLHKVGCDFHLLLICCLSLQMRIVLLVNRLCLVAMKVH